MLKEFRGQTAVVTGGASGIGRSLVLHALSLGMDVVAADRDGDKLKVLVVDAGATSQLTVMVTDVTHDAEVAALADLAYDRYGEVHLLCNNAGTSGTGAAWELDMTDWRRMMDINFMGAVSGVRHFVPRMLAAGTHGAVLNTASMAAVGAAPNLAAYVASKHALLGVSESLSLDLRAIGASISVSLLCPGPVKTDIMKTDPSAADSGRFYSPEMRDALTKMIGAGISPDDVATLALAGVAAGKFWIFTHPALLKDATRRYKAMTASVVDGLGSP